MQLAFSLADDLSTRATSKIHRQLTKSQALINAIDHAHASAARHGFSILHLRLPRSLANSLAHFTVIPSSPRTLDFDRQMPSQCNRQLVRLAIPRLGRRQGLQDPRFQPLSE